MCGYAIRNFLEWFAIDSPYEKAEGSIFGGASSIFGILQDTPNNIPLGHSIAKQKYIHIIDE